KAYSIPHDLRAQNTPLKLLDHKEQDHNPQGRPRRDGQREGYGGDRADERAKIWDDVGKACEDPDNDGVLDAKQRKSGRYEQSDDARDDQLAAQEPRHDVVYFTPQVENVFSHTARHPRDRRSLDWLKIPQQVVC